MTFHGNCVKMCKVSASNFGNKWTGCCIMASWRWSRQNHRWCQCTVNSVYDWKWTTSQLLVASSSKVSLLQDGSSSPRNYG
jgi:hypothetical protein